jgi:DNA-nicking Smr family endonuclease
LLIVELSEKGKLHDKAAKLYNQQAADFVFRANNAGSAPDEIDLHGLYVEEAANAVEIRIQACQRRHEDHLHVYRLEFYLS